MSDDQNRLAEILEQRASYSVGPLSTVNVPVADFDLLLATIARQAEALKAVEALHRPFAIYDECGHAHRPDEPGVKEVDDVGLVCVDGHMYDICFHCCTLNSGEQTENCIAFHGHENGSPICRTAKALASADHRDGGEPG